jgi:hypothetical protein
MDRTDMLLHICASAAAAAATNSQTQSKLGMPSNLAQGLHVLPLL